MIVNGSRMLEMQWDFVAAMPDCTVASPIECGYYAIVANNDMRLENLRKAHPNLRTYLSRFTDQFANKISPSCLLWRKDTPVELRTYDTLLAFRNAVAISCLLDGYKAAILGSQALSPVYSDVFDLYPITLSKDCNGLIQSSFGHSGLDDRLSSFAGQSNPSLGRTAFNPKPDQILLDSLLSLWRRAFIRKQKISLGTRVFRSLQSAYLALSSWSPNQGSIYDVGSKVALWISAFEILGHSKRRIDRMDVLRSFEHQYWQGSLKRKYRIYKDPKKPHVNLPAKICDYTYRVRHSFLHGNYMTLKDFFPSRNDQLPSLLKASPILYDILLANALGLMDDFVNARERLNSLSVKKAFDTKRREYKHLLRYTELKRYRDRTLEVLGHWR